MIHLFAKHRLLSLLIIILATWLIVGFLGSGFLSTSTASVVLSNSLILLCVSVGGMIVILTKNIDVSCGSILGLSAVTLGLALNNGISLAPAIALCLLLGTGAGLINGLLVNRLGIPSIIATLGTLGLFRGLMLIMTGGQWIEQLPKSLKSLASNIVPSISPLTIATALAVIMIAFALRTRRGQYFYATGDNRIAARHLGLPVNRIEIFAFMISGFMAALAGVIFSAQIGFIPNQAGSAIELKAIAANVLGGISLLGGSGSILGVILSVMFLTSIDSALVFLKIPAYWNDLIAGAILLIILLIDGRVRLFIDRVLRQKRYQVISKTESAS